MTQHEDPNFNKVSDEEINNINSRIKDVYEFLEKTKELPKTVFAKNIGMTSSFQLQKIWDNKNLISTRNLFLLGKHYNININWVLSGQGAMLSTDKERKLNDKIKKLEHDKNEIAKAVLTQGIELIELKKQYNTLYSLIEKLNKGGVFDVKLDKKKL
jgi:hypothetical protein